MTLLSKHATNTTTKREAPSVVVVATHRWAEDGRAIVRVADGTRLSVHDWSVGRR